MAGREDLEECTALLREVLECAKSVHGSDAIYIGYCSGPPTYIGTAGDVSCIIPDNTRIRRPGSMLWNQYNIMFARMTGVGDNKNTNKCINQVRLRERFLLST